MYNTNRQKTPVIAILIILCVIVCAAAAVLLYRSLDTTENPVAEIYQDGILIDTIALDRVNEIYTIQITASDGGHNLIEVRPGSIGVLSADCPDRYCVRQGFIRNSLLPVTCLPHRLVIQIRQAEFYDNQ